MTNAIEVLRNVTSQIHDLVEAKHAERRVYNAKLYLEQESSRLRKQLGREEHEKQIALRWYKKERSRIKQQSRLAKCMSYEIFLVKRRSNFSILKFSNLWKSFSMLLIEKILKGNRFYVVS